MPASWNAFNPWGSGFQTSRPVPPIYMMYIAAWEIAHKLSPEKGICRVNIGTFFLLLDGIISLEEGIRTTKPAASWIICPHSLYHLSCLLSIGLALILANQWGKSMDLGPQLILRKVPTLKGMKMQIWLTRTKLSELGTRDAVGHCVGWNSLGKNFMVGTPSITLSIWRDIGALCPWWAKVTIQIEYEFTTARSVCKQYRDESSCWSCLPHWVCFYCPHKLPLWLLCPSAVQFKIDRWPCTPSQWAH